MNIKQTIILALASAMAMIVFLATDTAAAVSNQQFSRIVCSPQSSAPAREGRCIRDANDGILSASWYGREIKRSEWRDKNAEQLRRHVLRVSNPNDGDGGNNGDANNDRDNDSNNTSPCEVETSILPVECNGSGIEGNPIWGILLLVIRILTAGVALAAVIGFVYAAILYTTAEDKAAQVTKAKETLFNVVLGIVLFALMYAFLEFIIPGGVFR